VAAGFFGAFPVNASPPRTAIVVETGGRSQFVSVAASVADCNSRILRHPAAGAHAGAALASVLLFIVGRIFRLSTMLDIFRKTPAGSRRSWTFYSSFAHAWHVDEHTHAARHFHPRARHLDLVAEGTVSAGARGQKLEGVCWLSPFKAPLCFLNAPTADQIH
jgi:hypothetical protein